MLSFKLKHALGSGPRLGSLALRGRPEIQTPDYFANTSRGIIPHISQDMQAKHMSVAGVYMALEDCEPAPSSTRHGN
jgi:queuine tRNA-ribosyltransferase